MLSAYPQGVPRGMPFLKLRYAMSNEDCLATTAWRLLDHGAWQCPQMKRSYLPILSLSLLMLAPASVIGIAPADDVRSAHAGDAQYARPYYLRLSSDLTIPSFFAFPARPDLGSSVGPLPDTGTTVEVCSVDTTDSGSPPTCSSSAGGLDNRCSVFCDSGNQCTAFSASTTSEARCSVTGGSGNCSIFTAKDKSAESTACSVLEFDDGSTELRCSIISSGNGSVRQCSAENPDNQSATNTCSVIAGGGSIRVCSVIQGGESTGDHVCSVFGAGDKRCSTSISGTYCSVREDQKGICSSQLLGGGTICSWFGSGSNTACSVFPSGPWSGLCSQ